MTTKPSASSAPTGARADGAGPLAARVESLGELLGLSRTRISPDDLAEAGELLSRIGERRRLSFDHTVVGLAGATGSGKSTLFNALAGGALSESGVRRPTTARPVACSWRPERTAGLLDRLEIAPEDRHVRVSPWQSTTAPASLGSAHCSVGGAPDRAGPEGAKEHALDGLVLLDLPDHDSAVVGHREQVDHLLRLVDVVVWVVDPEKYADAALHERYLRAMAGHADITVLVLNQVDRLSDDAAELVLDDLRRLLDEDGLAVGEHGDDGTVVLATSALTGRGVPDLRAVLAQVVAERAAAGRRLAADLDRAASMLRPLCVGEGGGGLTDPAREEFVDRLAEAVGACAVGQLADGDWARAAGGACGTPWSRLFSERTVTQSCSRLGGNDRRSPVRVVGAGTGTGPARGPAASVDPAASRAAIEEAVRALAADAVRGLPGPWARAVREAARRGGERLPDALDGVATHFRPRAPERPGWWSVVGAVQWLLMILGLAGAVCLVDVAAGSLDLPWRLPLITMTVGGLGGPVVAWACRVVARGPARRYGQAAERRVRDAAASCGRTLVLEPVAAELMRYQEVREHYAVVAGVLPRAPQPRTAEGFNHPVR